MINLKSRLLIALVAGVGMVPIVAPSPAHATGRCDIVCDGANPQTALYEDSNGMPRRCNHDARTVYTAGGPGTGTGYVELRYSPKCRLAWARANDKYSIKVEGFNSDHSLRVVHTADANGAVAAIYTLGVNDAGQYARACSWGPAYGWDCTPKY